jgi:hypothetical protein
VQERLAQQAARRRRELGPHAPRRAASSVSLDPRDQSVQPEQAIHETDLIEAYPKEELAERAKSSLRTGAATVGVSPPLGVGCRKGFEIPWAMPGQPAGGGPEPVSADAGTAEIGIREQPRHTPVSVEEWVDPEQSMVTGRNCDDLIEPFQPGGIVGLGEPLQEARHRGRRRRDVAADVDLLLAKLAGYDGPLVLAVGIADFPPFLGHPLVELPMQEKQELGVRDPEIRIGR